jgi:hypothetical protein
MVETRPCQSDGNDPLSRIDLAALTALLPLLAALGAKIPNTL